MSHHIGCLIPSLASVKDAQIELKAEIERSKVLGSKAAPSSSKNRTSVDAGENLKNTEVLKLYEDMTNLLVTNVRYQKGKYLEYDDCILTCVYTYLNENNSSDEKSRFISYCFAARRRTSML